MMKIGWLKQQKCITWKDRRPEVWHQGGCRAELSLTTLGENPPGLLLLFADNPWLVNLALWSHEHLLLVLLPSAHVCFCVQISPLGGWEAGSLMQLVAGLSHFQIEKGARAFICWHCMPWTLNNWARLSLCLRFSVAQWLLLFHYVF